MKEILGKNVYHRDYGKGEIIDSRNAGFELYIEFEHSVRRWVKHSEVIYISQYLSPDKKNSVNTTFIDRKKFKARQAIEALRFGIVPSDYIESFTFGREKEISLIHRFLKDENIGSIIISGEYGSGKTHLLEYIYQYAIKNNYAVSLVTVDPNECPFYNPKAVYTNMMRSFRFRQQNGYFREFLRELSKHPKNYEINDH